MPDPGLISVFLQGNHENYKNQGAELERLQAELEAGRSELFASWGNYWYETVVEMVEVEVKSTEVRAQPDSDYDESVLLREEAGPAAFLPLDDPLFSNGRVPINSSGEIYVAAPKRHFDAFVLLPSTQRDFVGD